jgi:hypothetical protein
MIAALVDTVVLVRLTFPIYAQPTETQASIAVDKYC